MADITFRKIDQTNEQAVRNISIHPDQLNFIESVAECLEEAAMYSEWQPVAIYHDAQVIGFAMYGSFGVNKDTWLDRIIIDKAYQGRGFGRIAIKKLIKIISKIYDVDVIYLSIIEENKLAYHLYESIGFELMDQRDPNGELMFEYFVKD